ncbi:cystinosin-like [Planoprotostelium fungivorum]|uniref:Cystinosin-like n=1 Tax=Planoprotostelium fungivorum TaxID=1890364 RepID=A0A2P6NKI0_9EUKA|nr:cystinosin-like [Planoprotostelium fungivorum]
MTTTPKLGTTGEVLSDILGWSYTVAWSVSFYPQVWKNWRRKSVVGLSFDFTFINVLGFACLSAYTVPFFFADTIKQEYGRTHEGNTSLVTLNDVVFALHALLLSSITLSQLFIFERGDQKVSKWMIMIIVTIILSIVGYLIAAGVKNKIGFWYDFLYFLSFVKLGISTIKLIPQAYMNFKRKSTEGWSIGNILLDLTGAILSIAQLILDGWRKSDWKGVIGNPVKFGLGFVTIFFDILFIFQHYVLYRNNRGYQRHSAWDEGYIENEGAAEGEEDPLNPKKVGHAKIKVTQILGNDDKLHDDSLLNYLKNRDKINEDRV